MVVSMNPPGMGAKLLSKTSTVPARKFVAYRKAPPLVEAIARPLKTAPLPESTTTIACVDIGAGTPEFQPEMVPSSLANRNRAGPWAAALVTTKPVPGLKTMPVGAPGTVTVRDPFAPVFPLYRVESPLPLSATHQGEVLLAASPQGLTSAVSKTSAATAPSETRLCWA